MIGVYCTRISLRSIVISRFGSVPVVDIADIYEVEEKKPLSTNAMHIPTRITNAGLFLFVTLAYRDALLVQVNT
jgi:hypothetical protein